MTLEMTTTVRRRKSYETRSGMLSRASIILAKAVTDKPAMIETEDGHIVRVWQKSESSSYSNADLQTVLSNRIAIEAVEALGTVPPAAIKYCVTKGWLKPNASGSLHFVTKKAALDLDLPLRFKGGEHHGRRIRFTA